MNKRDKKSIIDIKIKQNDKFQNSGVTLMVLIITIIVMIILAAVTINMATGTDGIIERTGRTIEKTNKTAAEEQAKILIMKYQKQYYEERYKSDSDIGDIMEYIKTQISASGVITDYHVKIANNYNVEVYQNVDNVEVLIVTGKLNNNGEVEFEDTFITEDNE